jgi:hypothetical protein
MTVKARLECRSTTRQHEKDTMEVDVELTPALLKFYRRRIHDLQREQNAAVLDRLKRIEVSVNHRAPLEHELLEYEDELDQSQQDIEEMRNV